MRFDKSLAEIKVFFYDELLLRCKIDYIAVDKGKLAHAYDKDARESEQIRRGGHCLLSVVAMLHDCTVSTKLKERRRYAG